MATRSTNHALRPYTAYQKVIYGLQQRQHLLEQSNIAAQGVLVSLLLLLATAIVNSFPDFRGIFNLIESFLRSTRQDSAVTRGEVGIFLLSQIEKYVNSL